MSILFLKLLNMSISASYIIVLVILFRCLLKKTPKYIFCILWGIVAFRLICPFSFESNFSLLPRKQIISSKENIITSPSNIYNEYNYLIENNHENLDNNINTNIPFNENKNEISGKDNDNSFLVIDFVWGLGAISILSYSIISYIVLKKKVSASIKLENNVFICDNIQTPFTFGIIKPKVYIPSDMKQIEQTYVLLHEEAHIKRMDNLWKPLGFFILSIHWFNPLAWIAYSLFCKDIEFATDEKVIKNLNEDGKKEYSEILLSFSLKKSKLVTACPVAFGENNVKERINMIAKYKKVSILVVVLSVFVCMITAICFLTNPKTKETINNANDIYLEYQNILKGNDNFYYASGEIIEAKNVNEIPDVFDVYDDYMKIWDYTFIDLDKDGNDEVVLFVCGVAGDMGGRFILHKIDDKVYGYKVSYRELLDLKEDGTFKNSDPTGVAEMSICSIKNFTKTGYTIEKMAYGAR